MNLVKFFSEKTGMELEERINEFARTLKRTRIIDIKFQESIDNTNQSFWVSALVIYGDDYKAQ